MYCLAPSVYAADIMQLEQQLRVMERAVYPVFMWISWMAVLSLIWSFGPDFVKDRQGLHGYEAGCPPDGG